MLTISPGQQEQANLACLLLLILTLVKTSCSLIHQNGDNLTVRSVNTPLVLRGPWSVTNLDSWGKHSRSVLATTVLILMISSWTPQRTFLPPPLQSFNTVNSKQLWLAMVSWLSHGTAKYLDCGVFEINTAYWSKTEQVKWYFSGTHSSVGVFVPQLVGGQHAAVMAVASSHLLLQSPPPWCCVSLTLYLSYLNSLHWVLVELFTGNVKKKRSLWSLRLY